MQYIIRDWAGNICFKGITFDTFDDSVEYLYDKYSHLSEEQFEEQIGEYYIEVKE